MQLVNGKSPKIVIFEYTFSCFEFDTIVTIVICKFSVNIYRILQTISFTCMLYIITVSMFIVPNGRSMQFLEVHYNNIIHCYHHIKFLNTPKKNEEKRVCNCSKQLML